MPLLLFSSAAPTYIVPAVLSHRTNATLHAAGLEGAADFPLYAGGGRRQQRQFLPDDTSLPDELGISYAAAQFQLLCTTEVGWVTRAGMLLGWCCGALVRKQVTLCLV